MKEAQLKQFRDAIDAHLAGKPVQRRHRLSNDESAWRDCPSPLWNSLECHYRPKPEPRVFWVNVYPTYSVLSLTRESADQQDLWFAEDRLACVRVVEGEGVS